MNDYDYIITIDENGSPCLQHALFGGGAGRKGSAKQNHKYYTRVEDKGKWRYFYSPEEFRTWSTGVRSGLKRAVDNSGIKQKKALSDAKKQTGLLSGLKQRRAQNAYNKTAMGKAEKAVRDTASDLGDRARGLVNQASGKARQTIDETRNNLGRTASDATKTAKKKIKNLTDAVQEHGNKALSELREAAGNVRDKAEGAARDAGARARKTVEDKSGVTDQKAREDARRRALMGLDDAVGDYADSDNRYQKSAKGRADKAVAGAKNAAGRARDAAEEAIGTTARKDFDEARRRASMGTDDPLDNYSDRENAYNKSIRGRIENASKNARDLVNKAVAGARDAAEEAIGTTARKDFDEARRRASMGTDDPLDNYSDRENAYNRTARGRAEQAARDVADTASDIRDRIRGLADSVGSSARNAASRAQNAAGEVTGANAKKEMDAAGRRAMMGLDDAIGSFVDAQTRYDNSAAGRTASAASNAQASLKAAQSAAKKALAKAMDYLPEEQIEEIKELIRGK